MTRACLRGAWRHLCREWVWEAQPCSGRQRPVAGGQALEASGGRCRAARGREGSTSQVPGMGSAVHQLGITVLWAVLGLCVIPWESSEEGSEGEPPRGSRMSMPCFRYVCFMCW